MYETRKASKSKKEPRENRKRWDSEVERGRILEVQRMRHEMD